MVQVQALHCSSRPAPAGGLFIADLRPEVSTIACVAQAIMGSPFSLNISGGAPNAAASTASSQPCPDSVNLGLDLLTACLAVQLQVGLPCWLL